MPLKTNQALQTASLSDRAYEVLKQEIISGNLAPGEKLNIHELSFRFQISRTPVKEAINRLAHEDLITIQNRKATFVSMLKAERIRQVYDIRLMAELWGVERARLKRETLDLGQMEKILNRCGTLLSAGDGFDYQRFNQADKEFHLAIVKAAQNEQLTKFYDSLSVHIQALRIYWGQGHRDVALNAHQEHAAIFEQLREYQFEKGRDLLTAHIVNSQENVIRALNERLRDPLRKPLKDETIPASTGRIPC